MIGLSSLNNGAALFPHELGDVVGSTATLPGRTGAFPAAERLCPGPGTSRCAGAFVGIANPGLDLIEEARDLGRVTGEDACGETVFDPVGFADGLVQAPNLADGDEGHE